MKVTVSVLHNNEIDQYIQLANNLYKDSNFEEMLPSLVTSLAPFSEDILKALIIQANNDMFQYPRRSWAIMAVADESAKCLDVNKYQLLQARTAWHLARVANFWIRPQIAKKAAERAKDMFKKNERGWIAACDWQLYFHPWLHSDSLQVVNQLEQSLNDLEQTGCHELIPQCGLSLAKAYISVQDYDRALQCSAVSEYLFQMNHDQPNQARCWLIKEVCLRNNYPQSKEGRDLLKKAILIFQEKGSLVDLGEAYMQLALNQSFLQADFSAAKISYELAIEYFVQSDTPLRLGACYNLLGEAFIEMGELVRAKEVLEKANHIITHYNLTGLHADNSLEQGRLSMLQGDYSQSLTLFQQAASLYDAMGFQMLSAVALMNLGDVLSLMARFQQSLHYLEQAYTILLRLDKLDRLAQCETRLAKVWTRLGDLDQAISFSAKAELHYKEIKQTVFLGEVYSNLAEILFLKQDGLKAVKVLEQTLQLVHEFGILPQIGLARRLLGEALLAVGQPNRALPHLIQAIEDFAEIGMPLEEAATYLALGHCYSQLSNVKEAEKMWQQTIELSQGIMPDITWPAQAKLAENAVMRNNTAKAIELYSQAIKTLSQLRFGFWQPALVGGYLRRATPILEQAVLFAAENGTPLDNAFFIEAAKMQAHQRLFMTSMPAFTSVKTSNQLKNLMMEIYHLRSQLQVTFSSSLGNYRSNSTKELEKRLITTMEHYDHESSRLERVDEFNLKSKLLWNAFDISLFRKIASTKLGKKWIALDYYLTDSHLVILIITPTICESILKKISGQTKFALERASEVDAELDFDKNLLLILGDFLVPNAIKGKLTHDTYLIIAHHRKLHRLPWPVLYYDKQKQNDKLGQTLIENCILIQIPSLQSLQSLWHRVYPTSSSPRTGLVIGLSEFPNPDHNLPHVLTELNSLQGLFGGYGTYLLEKDATRSNLKKLSLNGLSHFAFLHIATHGVYDSVRGRLSGIVLSDEEELLQDHLWELAPLPRLVVLSACNGSRYFINIGDEMMSLASSCLAAGAQSVIASYQLVPDDATALLMCLFYHQYLSSNSPAIALALAQREMIKRHGRLSAWSSFTCTGIP